MRRCGPTRDNAVRELSGCTQRMAGWSGVCELQLCELWAGLNICNIGDVCRSIVALACKRERVKFLGWTSLYLLLVCFAVQLCAKLELNQHVICWLLH